MDKKEFTYRNVIMEYLWFIVLGIPCAVKLPDYLDHLQGTMYFVANALLSLVIVYALWRLVDILPGTLKRGFYWRENGFTMIEYGKRVICLDGVDELMVTEKRSLSKGVNLMIKNHQERIVFLSEGLPGNVELGDTTFYNIFVHVLAENPGMEQEKDASGNPIETWYKRR